MASNDFGVSPKGRELEPRREGDSESLLEQAAIARQFPVQNLVGAKREYSAAPIYLIERRAIQLRRLRWQQAFPPPIALTLAAVNEKPETTFAEYVRPPPSQEATGSSSKDQPGWFSRLFRRGRRP